ncbi:MULTISPECIES: helix-turn-helix transcriptional regulator [unclassified Janthinobacterium]|uniref:helix-turn-helix transcriptional regulator n=1 Tax=unclassified Janthinobacterium TaxID=2610881 RepID=UPI00161886A8|nr:MULTISPECIES: helix-turn-helix transcriptional regulator [unclassified Janthinobacterium]MBB5610395.1 hypothetical protein [Janthinobacterium sp. S3T4]MBB5615768.1 hypothetical protein [Janthinobacterium sp. S3M3]
MKKEPKALEDWQAADAQRLKALFDARQPKISQADFGDLYAIGSQGMVWQYVAGHRPLNIKAATAFARGLNVNVELISPTIAKEIAAAASHTGQPAEAFEAVGSIGSQVVADYSKPEPGPLSPPTAHTQWIRDDEARLLDLYRTTDDAGRERIMTVAEGEPRSALRGISIVDNQS